MAASGGLLGFSLLAARGTWAHTPAGLPPGLELFALLRRHVCAAVFHAAPPFRTAIAALHPESAKQNSAEHQKAERLPESDELPAEKRRQEPVPQMHYNFTADNHECDHGQDRQRHNPDKLLSHH